MGFLMSFEISALRETLRANVAFVRLLSSVSPLVNLESAGSHEGLLAVRTFKGTLSGMSAHMVSQVSLCCKGLVTATNAADKGLFP